MGKPARLALTILLFLALGLAISVGVAWGNAALFEHHREPYFNNVPIEAAEWSGIEAIAAEVEFRSNPRAWSREFSAQEGFVPGPIPAWSRLNDPPPDDAHDSFEIASGWPFVCLHWLIDVRTQEKWLLTDFPQGAIEGYLPASDFFSSGRDVVWLPATPIPINLFMDICFWGGFLFGGWFLVRAMKFWKWKRCRRLRKCATCGYQLADAEREICTECGTSVHEMPTMLTMPRWSRLVVSLMVLVAAEIIFIVSFASADGGRALLRVAHEGDVDRISMILARGVDPDVAPPDSNGETALMVACTMGRLEIARLLIKAGGEVNAVGGLVGHGPLHRAAENGHVEIIKLLCEAGAVVDAPDRRSKTPLSYAIRNDMRDAVLTLIERGADVNWLNRNGATAMHLAAENGTPEMVKLLEEHGAPIDVKDIDDQTPMFIAVFWGRIETMEYLLSRGADISITTQQGHTFWSMINEILKSEMLTRALVEGHADINQRKDSRLTALMFAVIRGMPDAVRFLLEHGADPTLRDNGRRRAAAHIQKGPNEAELRKLLTEAEAKWIAEHGEMDEEGTP